MGGQYDGVTIGMQTPGELPQCLTQLDIHSGGRLVQHHHIRFMHQRLGDKHTAFHAAGEIMQIGVGLVSQTQGLDQFVDPGLVFRAVAKIA